MPAPDPDIWRSYASAPAPGTALIALADLPEGATPLRVEGPNGAFPLLLIRRGAAVHAFVNACPHQFLPLDHHGPNILSADGDRLMCTVHGAQFDIATGEGAAGHGLGSALDPAPVENSGGMVRIA